MSILLPRPAAPSSLWHLLVSLAGTAHHPSRALAAGTALAALAAVASRRAWPVSRTVITLAHEGGHALVALLAGRRLGGVRVLRSTAGVTVTEGPRSGPGIVLTMAAGYLSPPLLGLGAAALLATGHLLSLLLLSLAGLAGLAVVIRTGYGLLAVLVTGGAIGLVLWRGPALAEVVLGYLLTWFLLLGGVRPVLELARARRRRPGCTAARNDADQLARLTGVPGGVWVAGFGLAALAALAVSVAWLLRWP
jgi:hypothetical protein